MSNKLNRAMWMSLSLSLLCALPAQAQETHVGKLTGHADAGKKNYQRWCIGCHGPYGDGNGVLASRTIQYPKMATGTAMKMAMLHSTWPAVDRASSLGSTVYGVISDGSSGAR